MAFVNDPACPPPFISDADFQGGGGYIEGRFCGINPSASPGQKCCLPCPVQDWVYPADYVRMLKVANYVGLGSVALCGILLLSFLVLPPERSSRHYLTVGVTLAITLFSIPFVIPLGTDPQMCHDRITPNGQRSDASCAWTGALLLLGAMGSALWILLRALWLHLRVCWEIDLGRPFMLVSIVAGIAVPIAFTVVSMTVTGVSYRTGLVCLPNHHRAIAVFWAWEVGFAGAALLVQAITTGYCLWVFLRVLLRWKMRRREGGGTTATTASGVGPAAEQSSFASESTTTESGVPARQQPQRTWRQIRRMLLLQWRHVALTVVMAVESLFYIVVFVAQDTRFGEVAANANGEAAKTWSACLVLKNGDRAGCQQYADKLAISQDLVLGSLLLGSLIGTQNFLLLAKPSLFIGWWELLSRPFHRMGRRGSDLPLTSLALSERQQHATATSSAAAKASTTADAHDYGAHGTTPLMTSTNNTLSTPASNKPSRLFSQRRPRSRTSRHSSSSSSSFNNIHPEMPPVTIANPYKLSLTSERAASLVDPAERARLGRVGDIVDLRELYGNGVRDDSAAFNAARPDTPPPPPLPLNIAKPPAVVMTTTSSSSKPGRRTTSTAMATAAAPLPLPSPSSTTPSLAAADFRPLPAPAASHAYAADDAALPTPPTHTHTHTPSPPPPSHTPDYLRHTPSSGSRGGIANRHPLPSWARSSSGGTAGGSSGAGGGAGTGTGQGTGTHTTSMMDLRDAMRGGLALHPVRGDEFGEFGDGGGGGARSGSISIGGGGQAESADVVRGLRGGGSAAEEASGHRQAVGIGSSGSGGGSDAESAVSSSGWSRGSMRGGRREME